MDESQDHINLVRELYNFAREIQLSVLTTDVRTRLTPSSHTFAPHEEIMVTLQIDIPAGLTGAPGSEIFSSATVIGRLTSSELIGGVTRLLRIDN